MRKSFEKGGSNPGYFFELIGKVRLAAVMELPCNLGKVNFVINEQLFYPFYFMKEHEMLNCHTFIRRKNIRKVSIVVV
jgi:hypothetical protein